MFSKYNDIFKEPGCFDWFLLFSALLFIIYFFCLFGAQIYLHFPCLLILGFLFWHFNYFNLITVSVLLKFPIFHILSTFFCYNILMINFKDLFLIVPIFGLFLVLFTISFINSDVFSSFVFPVISIECLILW